MPKSRRFTVTAIVIIVIVGVFSIYAALTFPRMLFTDTTSFDLGADAKVIEFEQPILNDKVQVLTSVESGAALWRAQILEGDTVVWKHAAAQGGQTTYESDWMRLPSGTYNFTFGTIGVGSLEAVVTISTKGGFW